MILAVDSGATTSTWKFMPLVGEEIFLKKGGFNLSTSDLDALDLSFGGEVVVKVTKIVFFGAGVGDEGREQKLRQALLDIFPNVEKVLIMSDLESAGLAFSSEGRGIVSILGTGSNCGLFIDGKLSKKSVNLGYLLGDEGSGFSMGREVLKEFLYGKMSGDDRDLFIKMYGLTRDEVIRKVYHSGGALNAYVARFSQFLEACSRGFRRFIALKALGSFFETHLSGFNEVKSVPLFFSGSISWHFQEEIAELCAINSYKLGNIIRNPIDSLSYLLLKDI